MPVFRTIHQLQHYMFLLICEWIIRQSVQFYDAVLANTNALVFALPLSIVVMVLFLLCFRMAERC